MCESGVTSLGRRERNFLSSNLSPFNTLCKPRGKWGSCALTGALKRAGSPEPGDLDRGLLYHSIWMDLAKSFTSRGLSFFVCKTDAATPSPHEGLLWGTEGIQVKRLAHGHVLRVQSTVSFVIIMFSWPQSRYEACFPLPLPCCICLLSSSLGVMNLEKWQSGGRNMLMRCPGWEFSHPLIERHRQPGPSSPPSGLVAGGEKDCIHPLKSFSQ